MVAGDKLLPRGTAAARDDAGTRGTAAALLVLCVLVVQAAVGS